MRSVKMRELAVTKGWLNSMKLGRKTFDIRKGRHSFLIGETIKFVENETGESLEAIIIYVLKSWETPQEWKWGNTWGIIPEFVAIGFRIIKFEEAEICPYCKHPVRQRTVRECSQMCMAR